MRKWLGRLRNAIRPGRLDRDLERELRFHVRERIEELQDAGGAVVLERILSRGDSAEARLLRGTMKLRDHDYDGARADLEKAIAAGAAASQTQSLMAEALS